MNEPTQDDSLIMTTVRIGRDQWAELEALARRRRTSKAALIRESIDLFLAVHMARVDTVRGETAA